ncbi:MAG TPA: glycosyltransferase family 1 protein [Bryobacteraceae bacterium]|nr:glycosyltransferase family 1 protein [Bryobacteraceae bacterium]
MRIALDATYSVGRSLSGVGVYSCELMRELARLHPEAEFLWCYRPHRFLKSLRERLPGNCSRRLLQEPLVPGSAALFHGLNQRLPRAEFRAAVATFHDLFVLTEEYSSPDFRRRFEAFARDAAQRADRIIAVSEFTAGQVKELLGVTRERIQVIPHGVRVPEQAPDETVRERIVLHVGAVQKRKNVARLVRAFRAAQPGWRLVLVGSSGYGADAVVDEIERSPRRGDIELRGYVPAEALNDLYRRASLFAFPSLGEGFGIPVLEAMAWGLPVLTSSTSALAEVSGTAAINVNPTDEEEIASALERLTREPDLRRALAARGRLRAAEYTWEAAARKTWSVYKELTEAIELPRQWRS